MLIASSLFILLGTVVMVSMDTFLNVSDQVQASYANTSQFLPVSTSLQRLVRSEVEISPTPIPSGIPFPTGGVVTPYSTTFYANVGVAGQPAKVVATLSGTTFSVTDQLADAGTCPLSVSSTAQCTFLNNPAKAVANLSNVVNSSYPSAASPTPIFTYTLLDTTIGRGAGTQTIVPASSVTSTFNSCKSGPDIAVSCPGDAVQGVEIDLWVQSPGARNSQPAEDDTIVYRLSSASYQYSPTVG